MASRGGSVKVPVALPKAEPIVAGLVSTDVSLFHAIGSRIRVSTQSGPVEGIVYTADPTTNLLVLLTASSANTLNTNTTISADTLTPPAGAYRILQISRIQSFQILSLASAAAATGTTTSPAPPPPTHNNAISALDTAALQSRLSNAISQLQLAQSRIGPKGTSPTDQELFNALSRTHPTRWEGNNMIVSDTFVVEKPYGAANVRYQSASASANGADDGHGGRRRADLERMRKVVGMERDKCGLRLGQREVEGRMSGVGAGAAGARKGG